MFEQACKRNRTQYCHQSEFNKGLLFEKEKKYSKAIESFEKSILLEPKNKMTKIVTAYKNMNYEAHFKIANILSSHMNKYYDAIKHYKKSLKDYDQESLGKKYWEIDAFNNIAFCYFELGDFNEAIKYSEKVLAINKYDKDAMFAICIAYNSLNDKPNAVKMCQLASKYGDQRAIDWLSKN